MSGGFTYLGPNYDWYFAMLLGTRRSLGRRRTTRIGYTADEYMDSWCLAAGLP